MTEMHDNGVLFFNSFPFLHYYIDAQTSCSERLSFRHPEVKRLHPITTLASTFRFQALISNYLSYILETRSREDISTSSLVIMLVISNKCIKKSCAILFPWVKKVSEETNEAACFNKKLTPNIFRLVNYCRF